MLQHYIGTEVFENSMQHYIEAHLFSNTFTKDLLSGELFFFSFLFHLLIRTTSI